MYTIRLRPPAPDDGSAVRDAVINVVLFTIFALHHSIMARTGAKALYGTHHEPTRSDDELEAVFAEVMARHAPLLGNLKVFLAYEGMEVQLT